MICEMCGCTDERACIQIPSGEPCHWTRPGLCSACDEVGGPGPAIRSWPLPEQKEPEVEKRCVLIEDRAKGPVLTYERFKERFFESWERAHGEESRERLEEKLENGAAWLWYRLPRSHAGARGILEQAGVRVPNPQAMRRIMRVRRFVEALRATEPKGGG